MYWPSPLGHIVQRGRCTIYGAGKLIIPAGSIVNLSTDDTKSLDKTLDLSGTLNYTGTAFRIGYNTSIGVVNISCPQPAAFMATDCAWVESVAALLGCLYQAALQVGLRV